MTQSIQQKGNKNEKDIGSDDDRPAGFRLGRGKNMGADERWTGDG